MHVSKPRVSLWGMLAIGLIMSPLVSAQQAVGAETIDEIIVVTTSREARAWQRAPAAVDVLQTDEQLPGFRFDSAEILAGLPGIQADSRSNFAQDTRISLRGFGTRSAFGVRGINLRIDGIPLTMPDGQSQTSSLMLENVARVEVLRGPMASLYGNAAGGTIAFYSARPERTSAEVGVAAGEAAQRRYQLHGQWAGERSAARLQVSQFTTDGFRQHSSAERNQLAGQWYYLSESDLSLTARVDVSRDPHTLDPQGLTMEQWLEDDTQVHPVVGIFDPNKRIDHRQVSLSAEQPMPWGRWQLSGWVGDREIKQFLSFPGDGDNASGAVIDLDRDFGGVSARVKRQWQTLEWALGAELGRMSDRRKGFVNDRGQLGELKRNELGEVENRDVYSTLTWRPSERWQVQAGARHSNVTFAVSDYFTRGDNPDDSGRLEYSEPSVALGASYGVGAGRWFASIGAGFETPTLTELAYRNSGSGLNRALTPARNRQAELGWRINRAGLSASLTSFVVHTRDELVVDRSVGGRTTYRNGAETEREGLEAAAQWQLAPAWHWRLGATLLNAHYSEGPYAGNRLPGVARENLYTQLDWQPLGEALTLALAARYRGSVASGDDNAELVPGATVFDFSGEYRRRWGLWSATLWAKLANLADKKYVGSVIINQSRGRTIEPAPGRQFDMGVALERQW